MTFRKFNSNRFLLCAIFVGLNVLCFMGIAHGRHVVRYTRVNYSHIPAQGTGRVGSRNGRSRIVDSADSLIDHASQPIVKGAAMGPHTVSPAAISTNALNLMRPTFLAELLVRENVVALGSAPRAPGLGRAPPTA